MLAEAAPSHPSAEMAIPLNAMSMAPAVESMVAGAVASKSQVTLAPLGSDKVAWKASPSQSSTGAAMAGLGKGFTVKVLSSVE